MRTDSSRRVWITGLGPVTSIGVGKDAFWEGLTSGRSAVAPRPLRVDLADEPPFHVASMPADFPGITAHRDFLIQNDYAEYRDLAYALCAIDLAIKDAGITYDPERNDIGVMQAFEAPGMERAVAVMFETCAALPQNATSPPALYDRLAPAYFKVQPFLYVHIVSKAFGFHGFSTSVHNACSSGAYAIELAAQRIREGQAEVMIVAGGEAFDTGVRIEWFRRLGLYTTDGVMRPFDVESGGFYAGEGGGAIVLESASSAERRGARPYAEYLGGSFSQQGWKAAIPDVRANRLQSVIERAIAASGLGHDRIDWVVPHGASTMISDGYEASCIKNAFGHYLTKAVASVVKPNIGHMLASSTIVELSAALLGMRQGVIPGTLNTRQGRHKLSIPLITESTPHEVNTILKLSTGFTGHDAAGLYRRVD